MCMYIHLQLHAFITVHNILLAGQNIGPRRAPNTRLRQTNMEYEERARHDAHFQNWIL